jgi:CRISPR-associated DxTHG motif protein
VNQKLKLVTFLGTGNYQPVKYQYESKEKETAIFPEALNEWLQPSRLLVMLTPEAKAHPNWETLKRMIPNAEEILIPSGKSEKELWEIFSVLTTQLEDGDEVIFDVTHAFRSLPILALLAAIYLRTVKSIKLRAILYGAFEAKDNNRAPVFDLTPFVSLMDWVTASDKFIKTGDAREMAMLLTETQQVMRKANPMGNDLPSELKKIGGGLEELSQALFLTRSDVVQKQARELEGKINAAKSDIEKWAQPFTLLLDRVKNTYQAFAAESLLDAELKMIEWYLERGQIVQAVTLSREWLVTWTGEQIGQKELDTRAEIESGINQAHRFKLGKGINEISPFLAAIQQIHQVDDLLKSWGTIADLRNDIAHCGKRKNPRGVAKIAESAKKIPGDLKVLNSL